MYKWAWKNIEICPVHWSDNTTVHKILTVMASKPVLFHKRLPQRFLRWLNRWVCIREVIAFIDWEADFGVRLHLHLPLHPTISVKSCMSPSCSNPIPDHMLSPPSSNHSFLNLLLTTFSRSFSPVFYRLLTTSCPLQFFRLPTGHANLIFCRWRDKR
jgi:hypothetical protein